MRKDATPPSSDNSIVAALAHPNELHQLELTGAWEPRDSSRDSRDYEARRSLLLFIMETKIGGKRVEHLQTALGFVGSFAADRDGLSGGGGGWFMRQMDE